MTRLTQKQIITNLQYAVADYAGRVQELTDAAVQLSHTVLEQSNALQAAPKRGDNAKKLTAADVRRLRGEHRAGLSQRELAEVYEVNPATVSRIVRGVYHARVR